MKNYLYNQFMSLFNLPDDKSYAYYNANDDVVFELPFVVLPEPNNNSFLFLGEL